MAYLLAVAGLVLLVALAHLLGGWIYSGGFHASALTVRPPSRTYGVWVRSVTRDSIRLAVSEPRQDIGHPGTLGLFWEGGYGQVGEVTAVDGLEVTRPWRRLRGAQPPTCPSGPLGECSPVDLEAYAYPSDPSDVSLPFDEIGYRGPLGTMGAWLVPGTDSARWAIHVHGWTAERREAIRLLPALHQTGLTSMVIDYRNDLDTPQDPTGRYRFGLSEWEDVDAAVGHALDHGAAEVVMVGYSTGAAHVMSFLEHSNRAERVKGVVFDSPNILLAEAVRHGSIGLRFGSTPIPITHLMSEFGMWIADLRWKIDWERTNYVQRAERILAVPTLVFHGTSDHRVPISVSRQLEARVPELVTLVETQAAGHVMSWNADPARYERYLKMFLGRV